MKPRLFFGNFDFEHRLSEPTHEPPTNLKRLNAELATAWLAIAAEGDWIWTPSPIEGEFFHDLQRVGMPKVNPVSSLGDVPRDVEFVPWGWSAEARRVAERFGGATNAPSDLAVRIANSRATSEELERTWDVGLKEARRIEMLDDLKLSIRSLQNLDGRWVVKAEFSMSARERILGRGPLTSADENWVRRRLCSHGSVYFEPWVERIDEVGIQIDTPPQGEPQLIGLTPMLVDGRGQYAGSWFAYNESRFASNQSLWTNAVEVAIRAAKHLQSQAYFGPLGIDAMIYRDANGSRRIRPLQDINARWTMGRLSLGWRRLLKPGDEACWRHGSTNESMVSTAFEVNRIVATSPQQVGDERCHHQSRLLIGRSSI